VRKYIAYCERVTAHSYSTGVFVSIARSSKFAVVVGVVIFGFGLLHVANAAYAAHAAQRATFAATTVPSQTEQPPVTALQRIASARYPDAVSIGDISIDTIVDPQGVISGPDTAFFMIYRDRTQYHHTNVAAEAAVRNGDTAPFARSRSLSWLRANNATAGRMPTYGVNTATADSMENAGRVVDQLEFNNAISHDKAEEMRRKIRNYPVARDVANAMADMCAGSNDGNCVAWRARGGQRP
jgi:hypothetical protein